MRMDGFLLWAGGIYRVAFHGRAAGEGRSGVVTIYDNLSSGGMAFANIWAIRIQVCKWRREGRRSLKRAMDGSEW